MTFAKPATIAHDLTDMVNLSFVLAEQLKQAGIESPDQLRAAGARAAWHSLHSRGFHPSIQTLLALEGAIQGRRWADLPANDRLELIRYAAERAS